MQYHSYTELLARGWTVVSWKRHNCSSLHNQDTTPLEVPRDTLIRFRLNLWGLLRHKHIAALMSSLGTQMEATTICVPSETTCANPDIAVEMKL